jgi:hypothetical protein
MSLVAGAVENGAQGDENGQADAGKSVVEVEMGLFAILGMRHG